MELFPVKEDLGIALFYASRKSTFLPSLYRENFRDNIREMILRRRLNVANMFEQFYLNMPEFAQPYAAMNIRQATGMRVGSRYLAELIVDELASKQDEIFCRIDEQRRFLQRYIETHVAGHPFAFLDFGGGGTIQHQLSRSAPDQRAIKNYMFYAHSKSFMKSDEIVFDSFLFPSQEMTGAIDAMTRTPEVFETLMNGTLQTTLSYRENNKGEVVAVCQKETTPVADPAIFSRLRSGIFRYFSGFSESKNSLHQENPSAAPHLSSRIIERVLTHPTAPEANFLGDLQHVDNFGSEKRYPIVRKACETQVSVIGPEKFLTKIRQNRNAYIENIPWPEGALCRVAGSDFFQQYRHLVKKGPDQNVAQILDNLALLSPTSISVCGAGELFEKLLPAINKLGIVVENLVDQRANSGPYAWLGYQVNILENMRVHDGAVFLIASLAFEDEMINDVRSFAAKKDLSATIVTSGGNLKLRQ